MTKTEASSRASELTRSANLRQLLTRTTRSFNAMVSRKLRARGYRDVRETHAPLLVNLKLAGENLTALAKRAQMTKQSLNYIANELENRGYVKRVVDKADARARIIRFTARGRRLLRDTLEIVDDIEDRFAARIGAGRVIVLREALGIVLDLTSEE